MRKKIYYTKWWKRLVVISTGIMIVSIIGETFFIELLESSGAITFFRIVDIPTSLFMITDIWLQFNDRRNKKRFIRNHALEIIALVPFASLFLFLRTVQFANFLERVPFLTKLLTVERVARIEKSFKLFEGLLKLFKIRR